MGWDEFEDLAADVVTVEPFESRDGYGEASYGEPVEARARIEMGPKKIVGPTGEEVVSTSRVYLGIAVGVNDRLTLPEDAPHRTPQILRVEPVRDEAGPHHWVVFC